ncbi:fimbrial protein [Acinetobacter sp. ULE_I001]|uniref:fimbrial protein n=1 Tax=unclassified Acinetobacter TaxID=196816 RepID=UPI003AF6569A
MNKLFWFSVPLLFALSQSVLATIANCNTSSSVTFNRVVGTISNFPYDQAINSLDSESMLLSCTPSVAVRSTFAAIIGRTDLVGNSPFSVGPDIKIIGSITDPTALAAAKIWLMNNLKISFNLHDGNHSPPMIQNILSMNTDYNILPNTGLGTPVTIAGESYFRGSTNAGTAIATVRSSIFNFKLLSTYKPSAAVIDALNNAIVQIHLGTISYKFDDYNGSTIKPSGVPKTGTTEVYVNLRMSFTLPTCTMSNQIVNLATVPTSILSSNQTANEKNFNVSINCTTTMPNKILLAMITDSYTPNNINNKGILKNHPALANRSNVDVQLRDATDTPMAIGSQSSFYIVPTDSTSTTFTKALKARYFRSASIATPGLVQAQATVFIDYK